MVWNNKYVNRTSVICPSKPLTDIWAGISEKYPNYKIRIAPFEDNHTEVLSTLNDSTFDLIVSPNDSKKWQESFGFLKLGNYKCTVSMPRTYRLATRSVLSTSDLDIHPGLVTIPLDKNYRIPYGIVYQKNPSLKVKDFIEIIRSNI